MSTFNALLEQYVFRVAEAVIDQIDPDAQTQLINFISKLDLDAPDATPLSNSITACLYPTILATSEPSDQDVTNQPHGLTTKPTSTGNSPILCQEELTYQQQLNRLDDMAHQLGQVQAKLASAQSRLQKQIHQNIMMMERFKKYALP